LITLAATQVGGDLLQGNTQYRRYGLSAQRFVSLNNSSSLVLMGKMTLGYLEQIGDNIIPPEDRYRIGGISTLHGYNFLEVGGPYGVLERTSNARSVASLDSQGRPQVDSGGNPQTVSQDQRTIGLSEDQLAQLISGGIQERIFNLELLFPLAGESVRGVVFYDAGQVNAEPVQYRLLKETQPGFLDLLQSYGFGVRLITPLGVLRFEYGIKVTPERGTSPDKFDFTISTLF
ncbi:MAG TPA: BamA/TamA family outer membrane protein, partial [bacterium]|nr:BamA/TamA family outer membrane protein [bacterium]